MKIFDDLYKEYNGFFKVWTGFEPIIFIGKPEAAEVRLEIHKLNFLIFQNVKISFIRLEGIFIVLIPSESV